MRILDQVTELPGLILAGAAFSVMFMGLALLPYLLGVQ